jgi:hypothetical protein
MIVSEKLKIFLKFLEAKYGPEAIFLKRYAMAISYVTGFL